MPSKEALPSGRTARLQLRGTWQAALLAAALAAQDQRVRLRIVLRRWQQRAHRLAHLPERRSTSGFLTRV